MTHTLDQLVQYILHTIAWKHATVHVATLTWQAAPKQSRDSAGDMLTSAKANKLHLFQQETLTLVACTPRLENSNSDEIGIVEAVLQLHAP